MAPPSTPKPPTQITVPEPARYRGDSPKQAALIARQERLLSSRRDNLSKLKQLENAHDSITAELGLDLQTMHEQVQQAEILQQKADEKGVVADLMRRINRKSIMLKRRSVNEILKQKHSAVTRCERRASNFADRLLYVGKNLQEQIDELHQQAELDLENVKLSAHRVLELEKQLARLDGSHGLPPAVSARLRDQLEFEERAESGRLALLRASLNMCQEELGPTRALRNTAMDMNQEMRELVAKVGGAARSTGRQIEVLGMAADAALVVHELQESMADLDQAMLATEQYITQFREIFIKTVPAFAQQLEQSAGVGNLVLQDDLEALSREQARAMADRALMEAAQSEIEALEKTL